jgi:pyruvate kinase
MVTAVMVARGDLGVEIGFERMAEIQDLRGGACSDAAMSGRAECVMLNKGPYILQALDFLCDVLARIEGHQTKKSALMRKLSVAEMAWK